MQRVAQDWLVLDLSGGSPVALGVAAALQFGPTLLLSLWAGGARRPLRQAPAPLGPPGRHRRAAPSRSACSTSAGAATLTQVYVLCALLGCFSAVDAPVRQSFAGEMVGPDDPDQRRRAELDDVQHRAHRRARDRRAADRRGRHRLGVPRQRGTFVAVLTGLAMMRPAEMSSTSAPPGPRARCARGCARSAGAPTWCWCSSVVFFVSTFGINFFMTLAIIARNVFGRGAESYGLLTSALAVGCLVGAFVAARRVGAPPAAHGAARRAALRGGRAGHRRDADLPAHRAPADADRPRAARVHHRRQRRGAARGRPSRCAGG